MPETTPILGLQAPLGTEPVSQGDDLMRANNTILDGALGPYSARWSGESVRAADTGYVAVTTPVSDPITLTGAPAGLYLVAASVKWANETAVYNPNYGQLVVAGTTDESWRYDSDHVYIRTFTMTALYPWAGGDLTVQANWRGASFTLLIGSRTQVTRVSA